MRPTPLRFVGIAALAVAVSCGQAGMLPDGGSAGGTHAGGSGGVSGGNGGGDPGGGGGGSGGSGGGNAGAGGSGGGNAGAGGSGGGSSGVTLTVSKAGNGSGVVTSTPAGIDCGTDCTETFAANQQVTLTAVAGPGARFLGWTGAGCTGTGDCVLTLASSVTVTAAFALEHTLVVTRAGSGSGTVSSSPPGIDCGTDCDELYASGTMVTLTATAMGGSTFTGWSMGCTGTGPCTVTINAAVMVTATFALPQFPLTVVPNGSGSGTVTSSPAGINCGSVCSASFDSGSQVTLTAAAAAGSVFRGWSGGGCTGTGTCITTITAATAVSATFVAQFPLTISRAGSGTGTVSSSPAGIDCGTDCTEAFDSGTTVALTAVPGAGSSFAGWSGGSCTGTGPCVVSIAAATTITATFTLESYVLTVAKNGTGTGTVASAPIGINCGSDCSESWPFGTMVQLVPVPGSTSRFTGWTGGGCTGTGSCTVTVSGITTVTATFDLDLHPITVVRAGNGGGVVTSSPAGITCGSDCSEPFLVGTSLTLTAVPAVGSVFAGWSGACTGTGACNIAVSQADTVTATFTLERHPVAVTLAGAGTGTVVSMPSGIVCGADCSEVYDFGTVVTLVATPGTQSYFAGWSGAGCSGTGTCVITVDAARTVTATFEPIVLTVTRAGTGTGTVTSSPAGIICGADCAEVYDASTVVTLTAAPASGSTFTGWSGGGCSGTGACVVTMTAATSVSATFTLNTYALTVTRAGTGAGTVTSSPSGINCGTDCVEVYNHGTTVTLTAAPAGGSTFTGWSGGGCSGTGTCVVTLTAATSVTASFSGCSGSATFTYTGGQQTFTVPACATSVTIDAYGAQGGTATGETTGQNVSGGLGARTRGTFAVTGGQVLTIRVGGMGGSQRCAAAGGGGTYVVRSGTPLVIAGGGGGGFHCNYLGPVVGGGGVVTTSGGAGICAVHPTYMAMPTAGGTNGSGATAGYGGGGGGFVSSGTAVNSSTSGGGGYPAGSDGGTPGGGYGGGGGGSTLCCAGSGGGGGYSGGGGSGGNFNDGCAGGGGGSINNGTAQLNASAVRAGNGTVIITY